MTLNHKSLCILGILRMIVPQMAGKYQESPLTASAGLLAHTQL